MNKRRKFMVTLNVPADATLESVRAYIEDAVASHKGSLHPPGAYGDDDPGDPLFLLDGDSVRTVIYRP